MVENITDDKLLHEAKDEGLPTGTEMEERVEILPGIFQSGRTHIPKYEKIVMRITYWETWIPIICLIVLLAITFADVVGRAVFSRSINGTYDYTCFLMVIISSFAFMLTTMNDEHVEVTLLFNKFPKWMKTILIYANFAVVVLICVFQVTENWKQGAAVQILGMRPQGMWFPTYPFYYVISIGFALMLLVLAIKIVNVVRKVK